MNSVLVYAAGGASQGAASFVLLPFLSTVLTVREFASLSILTACSAILQSFLAFNSTSYPVIAYHENTDSISELVANFHSLLMISLLPAALFLFLAHFFIPVPSLDFVWFVFFHSVAVVLLSFRMSMLQMAEKPVLYFLCQLTVAVLGLLLSIILIKSFDLGLHGRLGGIVFPIFFVLFLLYLFERPALFVGEVAFDFSRLKTGFKFGISFLPYKLIKQSRGHADKFILAGLLGMVDVGILAMAISISMPMQLATVAAEKAFTPAILEELSLDDDRSAFEKVAKIFARLLAINLVMCITGYFAASWLGPYFIDDNYSESFSLISFIIIGIFMQSVSSNIVTLYSKLRKAELLNKLAIANFLNHIIIATSFVYFFGLEGAALGYMTSYTLSAIVNVLGIMPHLFRRYPNVG